MGMRAGFAAQGGIGSEGAGAATIFVWKKLFDNLNK